MRIVIIISGFLTIMLAIGSYVYLTTQINTEGGYVIGGFMLLITIVIIGLGIQYLYDRECKHQLTIKKN